ncbi:MAG: putative ABC transporter permease [Erysipelotrichaceae bacterium]|nr:putative ABC transporter permease [Erysipelotrichaceae bacterium]
MEKDKKEQIMGISIWRILAYFIIYSFLGYIIETLFGIVTKGVWESRQSFLYGPFCAIYGLGAVIMIVFLHRFGKKYNSLFIGGFIIGSITEYLVSLIGEMILGVKWWDYSNMPLNIGGRICVYFSIFWGFLAIYLIASINPQIDKLINWIKSKFSSIKTLKIITLTTVIVLLIDCIITGFAISFFLLRMIVKNDINVDNKEAVIAEYDKIYGNENLSNFIYKYWGDYKMIRTFPNLKVQDKDGNIVYMDSFLDIQPYYLKIHDKDKKSEEIQNNLNG